MPEPAEDSRSERLDIARFAGIIRRRHMQFLIPLFAGWLVVWGASWILSPRYKSSTTILVQQPSMAQNYVIPNVTDDLQARLQSLKTQMESQTRLLSIINLLHLYSGPKDAATMDEKVNQMRNDITVDLVQQGQDISAFTVSYSAKDPHVAQQVTGELTKLFIAENNAARERESEGTTNFLSEQLNQASANLAAQEAKVDQFQSQHQGALPSQDASNLQILGGLQTQLQNEQDSLNAARQRGAYLQAMLDQDRAQTATVHTSGGDRSSSSVADDLATVNQQLEKLRAQLADLSSRYTDRYPDVQSTKDQIAKTEALRESLLAAAKAKNSQKTLTADDSQLSAPAQQIKGELQSNQVEIQSRESAISELKSRIGEYQSRLNAEPGTEQQLTDLSRGYDQSKANYDDLLKKKDQSEMATGMEQMQQGERFTMLDPPSLPISPYFPDRVKLSAIGFALGLALGLIVAGVIEYMDDRMHSGKEIKALLPVAVISEIPEVATPSDRQSAKKRLVLGWATTAFVMIAILAGSLVSVLYT
jgi:polysaccharide chain length determinant protein (PEP-CTERM system associated)